MHLNECEVFLLFWIWSFGKKIALAIIKWVWELYIFWNSLHEIGNICTLWFCRICKNVWLLWGHFCREFLNYWISLMNRSFQVFISSYGFELPFGIFISPWITAISIFCRIGLLISFTLFCSYVFFLITLRFVISGL